MKMYYTELGRAYYFESFYDTEEDFEVDDKSQYQLSALHGLSPRQRFWSFTYADALDELCSYFGVDELSEWAISSVSLEDAGKYGLVIECDMPDDVARTLINGESIAPSCEQYIKYSGENVVALVYVHVDDFPIISVN